MLLTGHVWVSPGQWGNVAFFALLMACLGGLVVTRAARSDVTLSFIVFYMALVFGRSLWLGEPMSDSDPSPAERSPAALLVLHDLGSEDDTRVAVGTDPVCALVACGAWYVQFRLFRTNGLLWSLAACSITVPLINRLLPGRRYEWSRPGIGSLAPGEVAYETTGSDRGSSRGMRVVASHAPGLLRFLRIQG